MIREKIAKSCQKSEELKRVAIFFNAARYQMAYEELTKLTQNVEPRDRSIYVDLAMLVDGYKHWDNFQHKTARQKIGQAKSNLKPIPGLRSEAWYRLLKMIEDNFQFLGQIVSTSRHDSGAEANAALIVDLIANADRRASLEHKYEDGVARLYSTLERAGQFRLESRYGIQASDVDAAKLPELLRDEYVSRATTRSGQIKLGLTPVYYTLAAFEDTLGKRFLEHENRIMQCLSERNQSILGHGHSPVSDKGYDRFRRMLVDVLDVDETRLPRFPAFEDLSQLWM